MGGGAVGDLAPHQQWSLSWILPRLEIRIKPREMVILLALHKKIAHR